MPLNRLNKNVGTKLIATFLCFTIILTGCSAFSDNPVVQQMKESSSRVDLTMEDIDALFEDYDDSPEVNSDAAPQQDDEKSVFDDFIIKVQTADYIQYQRIFSSPEEESLESETQQMQFLISNSALVTERRTTFVITNKEGTRRVLHDGNETHLINLENNTSSIYQIEEADKKDLLYDICNKNITLLSVDLETIGETTYDAYSVTEGTQVAKWYFDSDGSLFLRIYKENDVPIAIRYLDIDFRPQIDHALFTLEGALKKTPDSSEESSTDGSSSKESSTKESTSAESSLPASRSSMPSSVVDTPPSPLPSSPPPSSLPSQPPSTSPTPSVPSGDIPPSSIPDFTDGSSSQTSKKPPEPAPAPTIPENYPHRILPIVGGFTPTYSKDDQGAYRTIELRGNVTGHLSGTTAFYEKAFQGASDFTNKEMYDTNTGYTYVIMRGNISGWQASVEIAESHATSNCSVSIKLIK